MERSGIYFVGNVCTKGGSHSGSVVYNQHNKCLPVWAGLKPELGNH